MDSGNKPRLDYASIFKQYIGKPIFVEKGNPQDFTCGKCVLEGVLNDRIVVRFARHKEQIFFAGQEPLLQASIDGIVIYERSDS